MRTHQRPSEHHITIHHVIHQRRRLNGRLALFLVTGTAVGVLFFGTIAVVNFHQSNYWLTLVGLAGVGGLVYGLYSYLRPYA
jgi:hypothetical protein